MMMMQQARKPILFFVALGCALALASAQSPPAGPGEPPAALAANQLGAGDEPQDYFDEGEEVTAEKELEEVMLEFDQVNADCDTLRQMLNETDSDPEASDSDKAEIEYALTGCLDILDAISLDIDALNQEIKEEPSTNSSSSSATAATVTAV